MKVSVLVDELETYDPDWEVKVRKVGSAQELVVDYVDPDEELGEVVLFIAVDAL